MLENRLGLKIFFRSTQNFPFSLHLSLPLLCVCFYHRRRWHKYSSLNFFIQGTTFKNDLIKLLLS